MICNQSPPQLNRVLQAEYFSFDARVVMDSGPRNHFTPSSMLSCPARLFTGQTFEGALSSGTGETATVVPRLRICKSTKVNSVAGSGFVPLNRRAVAPPAERCGGWGSRLVLALAGHGGAVESFASGDHCEVEFFEDFF